MIQYDAIVEYRVKLTILKKNPFKNDYFKAGVCLFGLSCVLFALECTGMAYCLQELRAILLVQKTKDGTIQIYSSKPCYSIELVQKPPNAEVLHAYRIRHCFSSDGRGNRQNRQLK